MTLDLLTTLMQRDHLSREDALQQIADARARVAAGADPEDVLVDEFGLEPDYIFDLL